MDIATLAGLLMALGSIVLTVFLEDSHLSSLWATSAVVLVVFGTIGATVIGASTAELKSLPRMMKESFFPKVHDSHELIETLVKMAEKARRDGLLALQDDVAQVHNPLLVRGIQMIVDGTDPDVVKGTMESQVELSEQAKLHTAELMEQAGGYAPTIGIIGTVMGLVHVLSNLSQPEKLGGSIAVAFLATLWGIGTANIVWLPLGTKMKKNIHHEALIGKMCVVGVIGLQTGEAPRSLKEKLEVYVHGGGKASAKPAGGEEA